MQLECQAQFSITGVVQDFQTNEPLTGATVLLSGTDQIAIADANGKFAFHELEPGNYSVHIKFLGYAEQTRAVSLQNDVSISVALRQTSIMTDAVVVSATRATDKTPTTHTTVDKERISQQNFGQDLPFLLNWTPSVVTTSDAGAGIGYTGIRIRGSDATRVNVTINGIPYNDSESLGTFWVNIPDIASSSQSVQIQRGVGTSTNGAGAFGASINLETNLRNDQPYAEIVNSFGSFRTRRHSAALGTGLLNGHWVLDARVSRISSEGYVDRASSDLNSYYFSGGYYSDNTMLKAIIFGGKEKTYQSWYGVPESKLNNDYEAMLVTAMNEGWNDTQTLNLLSSNKRTFNPYLYDNQVDDYQQDHYQLHFSRKINNELTLNTALHYTPGKGFFEEYRYGDEFSDYGLSPVTLGGEVIESTDLVRRRWLDNDFYGFTYSLNYDKDQWNLVYGGAWNRYDGDHFGQIIWASVSPVAPGHRYYFNNGDKRDFNNYLKANYQLSPQLNAFIDLQYRKILYKVTGIENKLNAIDFDLAFDFFNPKAGLTYAFSDKHQLYTSVAIGNKEPVRDDFVDNPGSTPRHETLRNVELGYRGKGKRHVLHVNYYLMDYKNQLVLTGEVNDVGASVRTNVDESYRMGVEIDGAFSLSEKVQWSANVTFSRNKIRNFTEVIYDYGLNFDEYNVVENRYRDTDISFSPDVVAGSTLSFSPLKKTEIAILTKYVGKQFMDNTADDARSIDSYLVNDVRFSYRWQPRFLKEVNFSLIVNNVLNEEYESNGYTWGYMGGGASYRENYFFPQAGTNVMGMLSIKL
jgi:iron complex outermembrane recepter protein